MKKTLAIILAVMLLFTVGCTGSKQKNASSRDDVHSPVEADASFQTKRMGNLNQFLFSYPIGFEELEPDAEFNEIFVALSPVTDDAPDDEPRSRVTVHQIDFPPETDAEKLDKMLSAFLSDETCMEIIDQAKSDLDAQYGTQDVSGGDVSGGDIGGYSFEYELVGGSDDVSAADEAPSRIKKYGNCDGVAFSYTTVTADGQTVTYYHLIINGIDGVIYLVLFEAAGGDMSVFGGAEEYVVVR